MMTFVRMKLIFLIALLLAAFPSEAAIKINKHAAMPATALYSRAVAPPAMPLPGDKDKRQRRRVHRVVLKSVAAHKIKVARTLLPLGISFLVSGAVLVALAINGVFAVDLLTIIFITMGCIAFAGLGLAFIIVSAVLKAKYSKYLGVKKTRVR
jgi:hypothetical protein